MQQVQARDNATPHLASQHGTPPSGVPFIQRVLITVGIVTAVGLVLLLFWFGSEVLLLVFGGVLLGVLLRGLADWTSAHTRLSPGWALAGVVLVLLGVAALVMWLLGTTLVQQVQQLIEQLPQAVEQVRQRLTQLPLGQQVLTQIPPPDQLVPQGGSVFSRITGAASGVLGGLTNVIIVVVLGLYFAADPQTYTRGLIRLVPRSRRDRARDVLTTLGHTLRGWLGGQFAVMAANGVLSGLGLWLLGIPQPVLLGIITGVLNFIPNIGPLLAAIPAVLLALTQGTTSVLYVVVLFVLIQGLEGFILTPLVQQRAIDLPPALLLAAQVLLGVLFGFGGVLLAVPLTAVVLVLVKLLYVEDTLGDSITVQGEPHDEHS